jgi:regulatory protein
VLDAAARLLEVRPRATGEVRRRLLAAGFPAHLVEAAIGRLSAAGYLDDGAFARAWVESRDRSRPRGEAALRHEMLARGVAPETIEAILSERRGGGLDGAGLAAGAAQAGGSHETADATAASVEATAAVRLLQRRGRALLGEEDPRRRRDRAYAMLARAGFDPETCRSAVLEWLAAPSLTDEEADAEAQGGGV